MVSAVVSRMRLSLNPNRAIAQKRVCVTAEKMCTRRQEVCPEKDKRTRFFNGAHAKLMTHNVLSLAFSFMLCGCTQDSPTQTAGSTTSDITGTSAPVNTDKSVALTAPAIQPDPKQLTQLGAAMHKYRDAHSQFPTASSNAAGQSGLSWRVHILPFLDQAALYDQFTLDEAWDSPQNLELAAQMPEVFWVSGVEPNKTVYHVFVGEGTPSVRKTELTMAQFATAPITQLWLWLVMRARRSSGHGPAVLILIRRIHFAVWPVWTKDIRWSAWRDLRG